MLRLSLQKLYLFAALTVLSGAFLDAAPSFKFTNLSVVHGLPQNSVWAILRDDQGFLWFGTDDGLSKFDGYSFRVYRHVKEDSTSLANNSVRALLQDRSGRIWVGNSDGVNVYDPVTDRFSLYDAHGTYAPGLSPLSVVGIVEDRQGNIWVGTRSNGIYRIDHETKQARWFKHDPLVPSSLSSNMIGVLYIDRRGTLWIGTQGGGINKFDEAHGTFTSYRHDPRNESSLSDDYIHSMYEDGKGRFWIGTLSDALLAMDREAGTFRRYNPLRSKRGGPMDSSTVMAIGEDRTGKILYGTFGTGLKILVPETGEITTMVNDIRDPKSLSGNQVIAMLRDSLDILWLGTYTSGISKFDPEGEHFQTYRNENPRTTLFTDNNIRSIYQDAKGFIWLGTANGLNIFDPGAGQCEHVQNIPGERARLNDNLINVVFEDTEGKFWIGSRGGLMTCDGRAKNILPCTSDDRRLASLLHSSIRAIVEDKNGILWIGTASGLCSYDRRSKRYTDYVDNGADMKKLSSSNIRSLFVDHAGTVWIATYGGGLNRYNRESGTFTRYVHDPSSSNSLSDNLAAPIREDNNGNLWIGTYRSGINKFDPRTGTFTVYTESDGLTNNTIFGIEVDKEGNLWIATMHGISCFTSSAQSFRNYSTAAGLAEEEFNLNCSFKAKDGTMFFGGNFGFNVFHPEKIRDNTFVPPVYITGMSIFNKPAPQDTVMTMKKRVVLSYDENSIAFDFVALNFRKSELNQYRYMLDGFDHEWSPAGPGRKAAYTNLLPGEYVFRVQGSNNDNVWNAKGASITIVITPPFWKTWWAYILYVVGFAGGAFGTLSYVKKRQRIQLLNEQEHREAEVIRLKNIKLKEANDEILRQQEILKERNDAIEDANAQLTKQIEERERLLGELTTALAEVKTLGGLIPICSSCKKIRDDAGYWNILESYLIKHSDAQFSHGICPDCATQLYPEFSARHKDKQQDQH